MSNIVENLRKILTARYGRDVRQSIHDAIHDCYEDGRAGATDIVAREMIADVSAQIAPATTEKAGTVKPDGETITVDEDGTIHGSASLPDNVVVFKDESTPSTPAPRDADTLGGQLPSYYATKNELDQIAKRQVMTNSRYHTCLVGSNSSFAMISEVPQNAISGIVKGLYPLGYSGSFQPNTPCEIQRGLGTAYFNVDEIEYLRQYPTLAMIEWTVSD